jgi:hypothetical protein
MATDAQLTAISSDFEGATARLEQFARQVPGEAWLRRPLTRGWSPAECVAHLNLTAERFLPLMRQALADAPLLPAGSDRRLRKDFVGWLLWSIMPPPVRLIRSRTTPEFVPPGELDPARVIAGFRRLQVQQLAVLEAARGREIDRVFVASPFNARVRYNLFACLGILARHQHRHLWQAEQAVAAGRAVGGD